MKEAGRPLVIITGPTAVGKTDLSVRVAKEINGEIVSADSIQVYRHMDIGSAKVSREEMGDVPHHLIDVLDPGEEFNICVFKKMAKEAVDNIHKRGKIPVIAGGTGFYIQSLLYDVEFEQEEGDKSYRNYLEQKALKDGVGSVHKMLRDVDPESADVIHENNLKRVIRALEFYEKNKMKISDHNKREKAKESPYNFRYYVLNMDREKLYDRINLRVDNMLKSGLVDEVKKLKDMGYSEKLVSQQGIGYKEIRQFIDGNCSYEESVELLKKNTRNFAKRQITLFKGQKENVVTWINHEDFDFDKDAELDYILNDLKQNNVI